MATDPATDVVNEALYMVDQRIPLVTGVSPTFDQSAAGKSAQLLYVPTIQAVGRLFNWDMARKSFTLVLSGNTVLFPPGWLEYLYPPNGIQVWQVIPAGQDPNDPVPTRFMRANNLVNNVQQAVLLTDVQNAICFYNNNPGPNSWDPDFREAAVRALASKFAESLSGRPETATNMLQTGTAMATGAMRREV